VEIAAKGSRTLSSAEGMSHVATPIMMDGPRVYGGERVRRFGANRRLGRSVARRRQEGVR